MKKISNFLHSVRRAGRYVFLPVGLLLIQCQAKEPIPDNSNESLNEVQGTEQPAQVQLPAADADGEQNKHPNQKTEAPRKRLSKQELAVARKAKKDSQARISGPPSKLTSLVRSLTTKTECNRVMGCEAMPKVVELGEPAVAELVRVLKKSPPFAPYRPVLLETLGKLKSPEATELLIAEIEQPYWPNRVEACIALGRIGDKKALPALKGILSGSGNWTPATIAAAAFALEKMGEEGLRNHITSLTTVDAVENINWGYTRVGFDIARELGITEALPGARATVTHGDYFLRESGLRLIQSLSDKESMSAISKLLGDKVPSLRRRARSTLKEWTGKEFDSSSDFTAWCAASPDCKTAG